MLVESVRKALLLHRMADPDDLLIVAVSGGPDSLALLDALDGLSESLRFSLHVAHLDHRLRSDSAADAEFVAAVARERGLPVTVEEIDVRGLADRHRLGLEEAARLARYGFLGRVALRNRARGVVLGHNADDQVETVVLHFLRGAGLAGLRGMRPSSERRLAGRAEPLRVYRPLLEVTRAEVESYCRERGLAPRRDSTNAETIYIRNRVRHELLPILREYNPRFDEAVRRLGRLAAEDEDYFTSQVTDLWPTVATADAGRACLGLTATRALPTSIQSRLLRRAFLAVGAAEGDVREQDAVTLGEVQVTAVIRLLTEGDTGEGVDWPRGLRVRLDYDSLVVERADLPRKAPPLPDEPVRLQVPGETILPTNRRIIARLTSQPCEWDDTGREHADFDLDSIGGEVAVRRRRPGDRLVTLGLGGQKKLQDLLVDAKIPRLDRDRVPVVVGPKGLVWVAGVRADESCRVRSDTSRVLCLRLVKYGGAGEALDDGAWPSPGVSQG